MGSLEADELIRRLLFELGCAWFGGRPERINIRPLDVARLRRLDDYIDAHPTQSLSNVSSSKFSWSAGGKHSVNTTSLIPNIFFSQMR